MLLPGAESPGDRLVGASLVPFVATPTICGLTGRILLPFLDSATPESRTDEVTAGPSTCRFDRANRELIVDGERRRLTPLEYGLLVYLEGHADRVVTRDDALRDVWNQPFGGSNVVDAVVRTLRRKLGSCAPAVETVKGHGYRYRSGVLEE